MRELFEVSEFLASSWRLVNPDRPLNVRSDVLSAALYDFAKARADTIASLETEISS
jgi:hypothetical protein